MLFGVEGAYERDIIEHGRRHSVQPRGIGRHRHIPDCPDTGIMELRIEFPVKDINLVTGIDGGIRIEHHIGAVIDPGDIADRLFVTYL